MTQLTKKQIFDLVTNENPKNSDVDANYYVKAFTEPRKNKKSLKFNKAAFFSSFLISPIPWLVYRKMYIYCLGCLVIFIALGFIPENINLTSISTLLAIAMGFLGNQEYKKFIEKKHAKGIKKIGTNIYGSIGSATLIILLIGLSIYGSTLNENDVYENDVYDAPVYN